jgi:peptidoglycan/LPS O-acetylase OafA/YrhL
LTAAAGDATGNGEIAALTGLRGCAALWVLLFHVWGAAGPRRMTLELGGLSLDFTPFFSIGWAGVQLFFVLSGFLLALPYADWCAGRRGRPRTLPYLARRCVRVLPGYYLQLAILIALAWYPSGPSPVEGAADALGYLAMAFLPEPLGVPLLNDVWWTLPIEFSFYLALPLLAGLLHRRLLWPLLAIAFAAMFAWRWLTIEVWAAELAPGARFLLGYQLPGSLDSFALGMAAALAFRSPAVRAWLAARRARPELLALAAMALGCALLYWMHFGYRAYWTRSAITFLWTPLFCLAAAALMLAAAGGSAILRCLLANRPLHYLGVVSYGIYLWHNPLLRWIEDAAPPAGGYALPWLLPAVAGAAVAAAALSWHLLERPLILLVRRRLEGGSDGRAVAAPTRADQRIATGCFERK